MDIFETVSGRYSVRGFKPESVPREILQRILETAQRAPSWCNVQPWRVWLVSGSARNRLVAAVTSAAAEGQMAPDFPFPGQYPEPYDDRRRDCGRRLYRAMGIERHDHDRRYAAWMRNYQAFGAPHVAIVGVDRRLAPYGIVDVGCWLSTLLYLLRAEGIGACPQASLAACPAALRGVLSIPEEVGILCGISIGYEDTAVVANACRTSREPLGRDVCFVDD